MPILLDERPVISVGDIEVVGVNFTDNLNPGETLTGTPTAVEQNGDDLTITSVAVNLESYIEAYTLDLVEADHAVVFALLSLTPGHYTIRVTVETAPVVYTHSTGISRKFIRDLEFEFV